MAAIWIDYDPPPPVNRERPAREDTGTGHDPTDEQGMRSTTR